MQTSVQTAAAAIGDDRPPSARRPRWVSVIGLHCRADMRKCINHISYIYTSAHHTSPRVDFPPGELRAPIQSRPGCGHAGAPSPIPELRPSHDDDDDALSWMSRAIDSHLFRSLISVSGRVCRAGFYLRTLALRAQSMFNGSDRQRSVERFAARRQTE
jgi:hypothetical protein